MNHSSVSSDYQQRIQARLANILESVAPPPMNVPQVGMPPMNMAPMSMPPMNTPPMSMPPMNMAAPQPQPQPVMDAVAAAPKEAKQINWVFILLAYILGVASCILAFKFLDRGDSDDE